MVWGRACSTTASLQQDLQREAFCQNLSGPFQQLNSESETHYWVPGWRGGQGGEHPGLGWKLLDATGKDWWFIRLHFLIPSFNSLENNLFRNSSFLYIYIFKDTTLTLAHSYLPTRMCVKSLMLAPVQSKFLINGGSSPRTSRPLCRLWFYNQVLHEAGNNLLTV